VAQLVYLGFFFQVCVSYGTSEFGEVGEEALLPLLQVIESAPSIQFAILVTVGRYKKLYKMVYGADILTY
jgi:hypothetical protein